MLFLILVPSQNLMNETEALVFATDEKSVFSRSC